MDRYSSSIAHENAALRMAKRGVNHTLDVQGYSNAIEAAFGTGETEPAIPGRDRGSADHAFAAVDAYLQEQIDAIGIPAVSIAIIKDGRQVHQAAFGSADNSGRPMTNQTPVLLASTSKSLTAIAVMQQVEAGRLELDEPVRTYLPWFSMSDSRAAAITVRHLLHQSSGLSTADGSAFGASDTQDPDAVEQGVRDDEHPIGVDVVPVSPRPAVEASPVLQPEQWVARVERLSCCFGCHRGHPVLLVTRRNGDRRLRYFCQYFPKVSATLCPPNPNELLIAYL